MEKYIGKNVEIVLENGNIYKGELGQGMTPALTTKYTIEDDDWNVVFFNEDEVKSIAEVEK